MRLTNGSIVAASNYDLTVGQGGLGIIGFGVPNGSTASGNPGNKTTIVVKSGTSINCDIPGGKASSGIITATVNQKLIYYYDATGQSVLPTITSAAGFTTASFLGGGATNGGGMYASGGSYTGRNTGVGNGGNSQDSQYGGGGGSALVSTSNTITTQGGIVSLNNVGGLLGITLSGYQQAALNGNQASTTSPYSTTNAGYGSGGGGGGLFWNTTSNTNRWGNGGNGGDGVIIVQFIYP